MLATVVPPSHRKLTSVSPLGRTILELCDETMTVNVARVHAYYPEYGYTYIVCMARNMGLHISFNL
jgi:hypothetical protein